ncbi:MAG: tRNA (mnm(5)s(2)U34)-methyltransferase [Verrucomicrobiales bacterium]
MRATQEAMMRVREVVRAGDWVVDGTLGNGHDALLLAELVGESGKVVAFDVQEAALLASGERLRAAGLVERVEMHLRSHEELGEIVREELGAAMFNLGYLPGSDQLVITQPEKTLRALETAFRLLRPGGLLSVVCYPGHEGGRAEAEAVLAWAGGVPAEACEARWGLETELSHRPFFVGLWKRKAREEMR